MQHGHMYWGWVQCWSEGEEMERDGNPETAEGGFPEETPLENRIGLPWVSNGEEDSTDNAQVSSFY